MLHFLVLIRRNRDYANPDVPPVPSGRHGKVGSLNSDHIVQPVQTVTHTVTREELTLEKQGGGRKYIVGHRWAQVEESLIKISAVEKARSCSVPINF